MRPQPSTVISIRRNPLTRSNPMHTKHYHQSHQGQSPISQLPAEVLSNIFLQCGTLSQQQPLVLTHVCSTWRKIAIHTPRLWINVYINHFIRSLPLPDSSPFAINVNNNTATATIPRFGSNSDSDSPKHRHGHGQASLANLWFDRAKRLPVSVHIQLTGANLDISDVLMPVLLGNSNAISDISVRLGSCVQLKKFFEMEIGTGEKNGDREGCYGEFSRLESVSLSLGSGGIGIGSGRGVGMGMMKMNVFENSPVLTSLKMDSISFLELEGIKIPWNQLKTFSIVEAIPTDSFHRLLSSCVNLVQGSFSIEDAKDDSYTYSHGGRGGEGGEGMTLLPNLTELNISFYGRHEKSASSLLTPFYIPNLLRYNFFSGFVTLPFLPLPTPTPSSWSSSHSSASAYYSTSYSHSYSSLQSLSLSGTSLSTSFFKSFALTNPSLQSLSIDLRYFTMEGVKGVLGVLAGSSSSSSSPLSGSSSKCFPHLKNLEIWTYDVYPFESDYIRMIKARGRGNRRNTTSTPLQFSLHLSRQQQQSPEKQKQHGLGLGLKRIDSILQVVEVADNMMGDVLLYVRDVRADEGI